ncbi:hypothetical protein EO98_13085 [Methanosarcina sp. 2.H.T.1A.6]|nr:hypothetical protein EO94_03045 [Methanosarcina sp. 2.H.T.1A.3]KKG22419.1 hypothetical protein EO96_08380 [Methanosarcina sp. 2.H.T.1A.8]KKG22547.1 hypothetical protein EO97_09960 [Methanosarcina sp. 2.H.T.1A.15]KKG23573.1 hypothetical protein EO98_13085 [Methanosarcina sp. 2.H.T.1A.6]
MRANETASALQGIGEKNKRFRFRIASDILSNTNRLIWKHQKSAKRTKREKRNEKGIRTTQKADIS